MYILNFAAKYAKLLQPLKFKLFLLPLEFTNNKLLLENLHYTMLVQCLSFLGLFTFISQHHNSKPSKPAFSFLVTLSFLHDFGSFLSLYYIYAHKFLHCPHKAYTHWQTSMRIAGWWYVIVFLCLKGSKSSLPLLQANYSTNMI